MIGTDLTTNCEDCGEAFPSGYGRRLCIPCRKQRRNRMAARRRSARSGPLVKQCVGCGVDLEPPYRWVARCCAECREAIGILRRELGVTRSLRDAIAVRDGWTCWICREPIDRDLPAGDPLSPTIDHVIALAIGGSNALDNIRLAHLGCNARRGVRPQPSANQASDERGTA